MSPEPETDAMREAVEALALHERINRYDEMWECSCGASNDYGNEDGPSFYEHQASALLEPRTTTCETCGGKGKVRKPSELGPGMHVNTFSSVPCPAEGCDQGQIVRPSLAVLRGELEQVAVGRPFLCGSIAIAGLDDEYDDTYNVPLYRFASEEGTG